MQGFNANTAGRKIYQQQTQKLMDACFLNSGPQAILQILINQKQVIQKLLENQYFLKARINHFLRFQTTDTEHNNYSVETRRLQQIDYGGQGSLKKMNLILSNQQKECSSLQRKSLKMKIQIICTCPDPSNSEAQEIQQCSEKIQLENPQKQIKRACQTKNIIKNYGKSILMFARKNPGLTKKIIKNCNYDEKQFEEEFQNFKEKVNSITELKLFWTEEGSRFSKVFRIISVIYLKKFSLEHTFKSRVKNYGIHVKYRIRLLEILKDPQIFHSIKYA